MSKLEYVGAVDAELTEAWPKMDHEDPNEARAAEKVGSGLYVVTEKEVGLRVRERGPGEPVVVAEPGPPKKLTGRKKAEAVESPGDGV